MAEIVRRDPAAVRSPGLPDRLSPLIAVPFTSIFVFPGAFAAGLGMATKTFGPLLWGGMFTGIPLVILAASSSLLWAGVLAALGLAPLTVGFSKGRTATGSACCALANLATYQENLTASESRIRDVDMAAEMTKFTKLNILQQAGTSMLAQANQAPQGILSLLRG